MAIGEAKPRGVEARVLILAKDDRFANALSAGLDRLDWRTVTARGVNAALAALADLKIDAAIIDVSDGDIDSFTAAARLKAAYAPRRLPVVALGATGPTAEAGPFDLVIRGPAHPTQMALRLESLVRASVAEDEFELRAKTFAERGRRLAPPDAEAHPLKVLTVGAPAPKFLALSHALRQLGGEVTGAFTAYTAFDYLHDRTFDAVVLWGGEGQTEAMSIVAGMRRNTRLFHIPTLLYLACDEDIGQEAVFTRGLTDLASADTPETETASRVAALARTYRRESAIRAALEKARGSGLMDPATGLFTRDLFAAHLARLAPAMQARGRKLTLAVLKITETADTPRMRAEGWLDRAIPQIGSMMGRLVRAEDTVARLGPDLFALALPAAGAAAGRAAAERIAAVIACTAFDAGENQSPFTVEFSVGVSEASAGESPVQALERAASHAAARQAL